MIDNREKQQIITVEKLETVNVKHFPYKNKNY